MAFSSLGNALCFIDYFSRPITLRHKGYTSYKTIAGGLISLMIFIGLAAGLVYEFYLLDNKPEFTSVITKDYIEISTDGYEWSVNATDSTLAFRLKFNDYGSDF